MTLLIVICVACAAIAFSARSASAGWSWLALAAVLFGGRRWWRKRSYPAGRSKAHGATRALFKAAQVKERELLTPEPYLLPDGSMGERTRWERVMEAAGLPGSTCQQIEATSVGYTYQVELPLGGTLERVQGARGALASAFDAGPGSVAVEQDQHRARVVRIRVREGVPESDPLPWKGAPADASITKPVTFGRYDSGEPLTLHLRNRHVLIAGATDSGKSGVLNALVGYLTACRDVVLLGIDLKPGGLELRPWAPVFQRLATSKDDAEKLLRMASLELDRRGDVLGDDGARKWTPSPAQPAWVLVIDELRELTLDDECRALLEHLTSVARAFDVTVVGATQYPTKQDLKSSVLVEQMTAKIALYVESPTASRVIFGDKATQQGWTPDEIDGGPGTLYMRSRESRKPRLARAFYVTDEKVRETVKRYRDRRPALVPAVVTPRAGQALNPPPGAVPNHDTNQGEPDGSGGGGVGSGDVLVVLQESPEPLRFSEIVMRSTASRATVARRLNSYLEADPPLVEQLPDKRWRAVS